MNNKSLPLCYQKHTNHLLFHCFCFSNFKFFIFLSLPISLFLSLLFVLLSYLLSMCIDKWDNVQIQWNNFLKTARRCSSSIGIGQPFHFEEINNNLLFLFLVFMQFIYCLTFVCGIISLQLICLQCEETLCCCCCFRVVYCVCVLFVFINIWARLCCCFFYFKTERCDKQIVKRLMSESLKCDF